jgi:hypothetical protein
LKEKKRSFDDPDLGILKWCFGDLRGGEDDLDEMKKVERCKTWMIWRKKVLRGVEVHGFHEILGKVFKILKEFETSNKKKLTQNTSQLVWKR